ncbi:MAG: chemotaxis response regulator protein-glutamate methylesterase [Gammaproteobacteria bacterium]|nr:chemotaxis response regulator protein-glutamate methylesterase [Gammaproteobacteria bacterium]
MTVRVLIVDDSRFFRNRVSEIIAADPLLEVIGTASNGQEAIVMAHKLAPDVITMDVEMPIMDGISAVREIMARKPTPILMFSSMTTAGAKVTLDALEAGAVDFLPKKIEDIASNFAVAASVLRHRIYHIGKKNDSRTAVDSTHIGKKKIDFFKKSQTPSWLNTQGYGLLAIAASTGGPVAIQNILEKLPENFSLPIIVIQHMPAAFTGIYSERLNQASAIKVKLAENNDFLQKGVALIAPGGKQFTLASQGAEGIVVKLKEAVVNDTYKPSVDISFRSVAEVFSGKTLAIILTGMGRDGCKGSQLIKAKGGTIWAQDEVTSIIYGMPGAVVDAGICDSILPLPEIGARLRQGV